LNDSIFHSQPSRIYALQRPAIAPWLQSRVGRVAQLKSMRIHTKVSALAPVVVSMKTIRHFIQRLILTMLVLASFMASTRAQEVSIPAPT
jgi:hypothetical protein